MHKCIRLWLGGGKSAVITAQVGNWLQLPAACGMLWVHYMHTGRSQLNLLTACATNKFESLAPEPRDEAVAVVAVGTRCSVSPLASPLTAPTACEEQIAAM